MQLPVGQSGLKLEAGRRLGDLGRRPDEGASQGSGHSGPPAAGALSPSNTSGSPDASNATGNSSSLETGLHGNATKIVKKVTRTHGDSPHQSLGRPVNMKRSDIMRKRNETLKHKAEEAEASDDGHRDDTGHRGGDHTQQQTSSNTTGACKNLDSTVADSDDDGCPMYDGVKSCGHSDTDHFFAHRLCCACGGGLNLNMVVHKDCEDTSNNRVDSEQDDCSEYLSSDACGRFETPQFNSLEMCCVCGGGTHKAKHHTRPERSNHTSKNETSPGAAVERPTVVRETTAEPGVFVDAHTTLLAGGHGGGRNQSAATSPLNESATSTAEPTPLPKPSKLLLPSEPTVPAPEPLILPERFAKVERGGDWVASPFVSQNSLNTLWTYLFGSYSKSVPPVPLDGGPLAVGVGINFVKFKDVDEVGGTINIAVNLRLCWADDRLDFDPQRFFNRSWSHEGDKIPLRSDLIWTPDVVVLNEVESMGKAFGGDSSTLVLSDQLFKNETGVNVLWSRPLNVKSQCNVDMSQYPFDVQRCQIVIGSWASSRRQMLLVPQQYYAEDTIKTSEFNVLNITVFERDVYTRGAAQMFNEVVYELVLDRYPHYYVMNFIIPMVALTFLTVATMWIAPSNMGPRVNAATKLLLCIVSIVFITARQRPPIHGDIWLDRFQSHCLALSMTGVLQSLMVDYMQKVSKNLGVVHRVDQVDTLLRSVIFWVTSIVLYLDISIVRSNKLTLYASGHADSTRLLVIFVYIIFFGLAVSTVLDVTWIFMPRRWQHACVGKDESFQSPISERVATVRTPERPRSSLTSLSPRYSLCRS